VRNTLLSLCSGCLLLGAGAGAAAAKEGKAAEAAPVDTAADVSAVKDKLKLLTDGKKHYFALVPFGPSEHVYYGDGKVFHAQRIIGGGKDGTTSFEFNFWEPRVNQGRTVELKAGKYSVTCDKRETALTLVPDAEAKGILAAAKFFTPRWKHKAHALARDDRGVYYYVDQAREPADSKVFRLFSGPKGGMKPLKMTNVVSDSEGEIFTTPAGDLRLILDRGETAWVQGKKRTLLTNLNIEDNPLVIYNDLGVYVGQRLGTPCDDL
jgi:hypothetical protein